jgi:hypothetical protein
MDDCIGRLVAAGVERATLGRVAGPTPQWLVLVGGTSSTPRARAPGRSHGQRRSACGNLISSHSLGASSQG